jgi:hypothetical protein
MTRSRQLAIVGTICGLCLTAVALADTPEPVINWQETWVGAQAAARKSGRWVLAYIYHHNQPACVEMDGTTLATPAVIEALSTGFEPLQVNGGSSRAQAFLDHYAVGTRESVERGVAIDSGAYPAYLLLDAKGTEAFRGYGYYPPDPFGQLLEQLHRVATLTDALAAQPQDARVAAQLGHLYLELERPAQGTPLLERAVQLDPENRAGARQEAELDLTILAIPERPDEAFGGLVSYSFSYPESTRGLEVRYYMAVARIAGRHYDQAEKLLLDFAAIPQDHPDYRSPWTARADLLLRQLRELLKQPAPSPKP